MEAACSSGAASHVHGEPGACERHPLQPPSAGVCCACVMERFGPAAAAAAEISEVAGDGAVRPSDSSRVRKTLSLLFQLDDEARARPSCESEKAAAATKKKPSWLASLFRRRSKKPKEKTDGAAAPAPATDECRPTASGRFSCDWSAQREARRHSWAPPPRHSWDGTTSVASKALACSLACVDGQRRDGSLNTARRSSAGDAGEAPAETSRRSITGWSKVWDRSAGSPQVADRRNSTSKMKETTAATAMVRSRSVRHPSPGGAGADSGLLRFYLTPTRTIRSSGDKGRRKAPTAHGRPPSLSRASMLGFL